MSGHLEFGLDENAVSDRGVTPRAVAIGLVYPVDVILAFALRMRSTDDAHFISRRTSLPPRNQICDVIGLIIHVAVGKLRPGMSSPASAPGLVGEYSLGLTD